MADVDPIHRAAELVKTAEALVITAGAGMGVDSGLPDFRSNEGFWNAYPPFRHLALEFSGDKSLDPPILQACLDTWNGRFLPSDSPVSGRSAS